MHGALKALKVCQQHLEVGTQFTEDIRRRQVRHSMSETAQGNELAMRHRRGDREAGSGMCMCMLTCDCVCVYVFLLGYACNRCVVFVRTVIYGCDYVCYYLHLEMCKSHAFNTITPPPRPHAPLSARLEDGSDLVQNLLWGKRGA